MNIFFIALLCYCYNITFHSSTGCTKDYVQFYFGNSLHSGDLARYSGYIDGRICDRQAGNYFYTLNEMATVFFHTDGSGSGSQGFRLSFEAVGKRNAFEVKFSWAGVSSSIFSACMCLAERALGPGTRLNSPTSICKILICMRAIQM